MSNLLPWKNNNSAHSQVNKAKHTNEQQSKPAIDSVFVCLIVYLVYTESIIGVHTSSLDLPGVVLRPVTLWRLTAPLWHP